MIVEVKTGEEIREIAGVIAQSFITVAADFNLTPENAPTNPAFTTFESLAASINSGLKMYGIIPYDRYAGCVGIMDSGSGGIFYIERLAVLPEERHRGYGKELLDFACNLAVSCNGKTAAVGIINENEILRNWYIKNGFAETGTRKFNHLPFTVCFMQKKLA